MKSFVAYPLEPGLITGHLINKVPKKIDPFSSLYRKVKHLSGSIVQCGINHEEGFGRFCCLKGFSENKQQHTIVAFDKPQPVLETSRKNVNPAAAGNNVLPQHLLVDGARQNIDYVPGDINDAIPEYLIENPELKIVMLTLNTDDHDSTLTALDFLFPRLVEGGILVLENYYKKDVEFAAVNKYFAPHPISVYNYSAHHGPHFLINN